MDDALSKLSGITRYANNKLIISKLSGIARIYQENLIVNVVDETGGYAQNVKLGITRNDEAEVIYSLSEGQYFEKVSAATSYILRIVEDDRYIAMSDPLAFQMDGSTTQQQVLEARKVYYYHTLAKKGISRSEESDRIKLTK